jgi:hypothetical protein
MTSIRTIGGMTRRMSVQGRKMPQATGFTVAQPAAGPEPAMVASVVMGGLLALQDEAAPAQRDRAAKRGGEAVLAELSRLQAAMLDGRDGSMLDSLSETLARLPEAASPHLKSILAAIRIRAGLELARRGRFVTTS